MRVLIALAILAATCVVGAAARDSWTGTYRCGPSSGEGGGAAFSSRVSMVVESGEAHITRESAAMRENLSGRVAPDGTVKLEGRGARKEGGTGWLYRFEGRIDGDRFEARGAMLTPNLTTRLRECSISLTRAKGAEAPIALEPSVTLKSPAEAKSAPVVVAQAPAKTETAFAKTDDKTGESVERRLDFAGKAETAMMEGTVSRGAPHRYLIDARQGQALSAALRSDGARFDLYEPGSKLTLLSGGFVVQGTRLGARDDGSRVELELPADGKYLLLVRPNGERAFYTLELKVERPPQSALGRWIRDERVWIAVAVVVAIALFFVFRRKRERRLFKS